MNGIRDELVEFLGTIARPGGDVQAAGDDDDLVDAGVIDSLAVIQIIIYLESVHQVNASAIDPMQLGTIAGILGAIDR